MNQEKAASFFTVGNDAGAQLFDSLTRSAAKIYHQPAVPTLIEESLRRREAILTDTGALRATTGKYTGRSPKDKFIVDDDLTHERVDWGKVNQPMASTAFEALAMRMSEFAAARDLFVFDGFAGADPKYRLPIRVVTEFAWHSLFIRNLLIRPTEAPEGRAGEGYRHTDGTDYFLLLDLPSFKAEPERDGTHSETVIALDLSRHVCLIGGTEYAGEIKKSIFTAMNFVLPRNGVFPMHCSANAGEAGDVALFFGLSGTGKTTLSADPERDLIGDDEHGWSDRGVFNFEGGCYAKCIRLRREGEPEIWNAIQFGSVLENVVVEPSTRVADYDDTSLTENTRCAYPIDYIPHALIPGVGAHPRAILFLTADAFGVLPPVSRLTRDQALYHFLSGYTSKLAGTERGVTEPEPNFSACFGAPFWPLAPIEYARMLGDRLDAHAAICFLVNTGWSGGAYGVGSRIDLAYTRAIVHAVLRGDLDDCRTVADPVFGLQIPLKVDGVPDSILLPWLAWPDRTAYDVAANTLAQRFNDNFKKFAGIDSHIVDAGPRIVAPRPTRAAA